MSGWYQKLRASLSSLLSFGNPRSERRGPSCADDLPPVFFSDLEVLEKTPSNEEVRERQFISVVYKNAPRWAMFKCPCGCGNTISLPLQAPNSPRWSVEKSSSGRPTLFPSVWQNKGCMSHFWIKDGRIFWCTNSGVEPSKAFPDYYEKRA